MSDLMREEFEQFIEENGLARACSGSTDDQRGISAFWFVWQKSWKASRECLVIELPKKRYEWRADYVGIQEDSDGKLVDIDNVSELIHAAGVKTK